MSRLLESLRMMAEKESDRRVAIQARSFWLKERERIQSLLKRDGVHLKDIGKLQVLHSMMEEAEKAFSQKWAS